MVYLGVMLAPCLGEVNDEATEFLGQLLVIYLV
jgi:hypothetical protein